MNVAAAQVPLHDAGNTFVTALSQTTRVSLFSSSEKKILVALCIAAFALPLTASAVILKTQAAPTALRLDSDQIAQLTPANITQGSDDLAMAQIFLDKASESLLDPKVSAQYLSQAESLLSLTTQTGVKVEELKNQLASYVGAKAAPSNSLQRIAAPASTASAIESETTSNANSQSIVIPAGTQEIFVPYTQLQMDTQIYVTIPENRDNAVVYVSRREEGRGFTLASASILRQDVKVTWYEIKSQ
jgi:hypothetical protein